jgi:exopolysaccharide biosynthesis polyprenyl glycosylphosphotransferase
MEKRRVDRSRVPLSVALFRFDEKDPGENPSMWEFLVALQKTTRETDVKGLLDPNVIGLMLIDTDRKGIEKCLKKIMNGGGDLSCSVVTGTYPDKVFEKLLSEDPAEADFLPLDLDESLDSRGLQRALKRGLDVSGALIALLLASPIMLTAAIAVKLTSSGPVIFKQTRLGEKGNRFPFYKFRSMYWKTDDRIHREYVSSLIKGEHEKINQGEGDKPLYKIKEDPRITRLGKIIRKLSVDELPQLYNVLKGEMSLVGPRPPIPYEVEKYDSWHLRRILEVKPGITGLWQVDGRSRTSFDDMVRLDLRYAQSWSVWLDVKILLKTVKAVLRPKGAL